MPPTTITPVAAVRSTSGNQVTFATVDDANGNDWINTGNELVLIDNTANANPATATFTTPGTRDGLAITDLAVVVPAGEFHCVGPFPKEHYNPADNQVDIAWSGTTISSCTVAIVSAKE